MPNPFTPGFGTPPTVLYGRDTEMALIDRTSFTLGARRPAHSRATIITGNRGIGKTTLLTATVRRAEAMGIPVLRVGAKRGFLNDVHYAVDWLIDELHRRPNLSLAEINIGLTAFGVGIPGAKLTRSKRATDAHARPFGASIRALIDLLLKRKMPGLMIVIDEMNFKHARDATLEQIISFSSAYQSLIEDELPVAVVLSGLPIPIERARRNQHISFLTRAQEIRLDEFTYAESMEVIRAIARASDTSIAEPAIEAMAALSRGNTYMIQEIGYLAYEHANGGPVSLEDVLAVRSAFLETVIGSVAGVAYDELTAKQRLIIRTIAGNPEITPKEMAQVLNTRETGLPAYRKDLVDAGILVADPGVRGRFIIAFPYMREYALSLEIERADERAYDRVTGFPEV
ncbi:ATP-binding protein [Agromyces aerolatus]|uniref:ATP-binding protein n=1 Tax=Agromyces sp. LY-1074 TaxID=3074080 RepID=UPI002860B8F6|nr:MULTISPECIES: ATP-binding protein [unclassified Agromyces]MDR5699452.1 ATP-binding protein [Agromyces sp. LY-1074]MDR5705748.1 ATP-binding protein [Agromyces sp. LY-1358]